MTEKLDPAEREARKARRVSRNAAIKAGAEAIKRFNHQMPWSAPALYPRTTTLRVIEALEEIGWRAPDGISVTIDSPK